MKTVILSLKDRHIQHGVKGDCSACPWALALQEALYETDNILYVVVNSHTMKILWKDKTFLRAATPPTVARSIQRFDRGFEIEPETVEVHFGSWDVDEGI